MRRNARVLLAAALAATALTAVWIAASQGATTPAVREFPFPAGSSAAGGIAAGPDGNLWFTELIGGSKIGRITPSRAFTQTAIPTANGDPFGIAAGPDGRL